jgi:hypothetical protein
MPISLIQRRHLKTSFPRANYLSKVNIMSEQEDEEQLADILLLLIPVQGLVALVVEQQL